MSWAATKAKKKAAGGQLSPTLIAWTSAVSANWSAQFTFRTGALA
jgi:hypothetical protein